jgi:serine phosphatase RsbU (regulator of sigma subunit)
LNTALEGLQEREELKGSLSVAAEIQQGLLPDVPQDVQGYAFAALQKSCHAVGGDYYDVIPLSDGRYWLVMADVAGKGYPAALTVANIQAMLQVLAAQEARFDDALAYINRSLCKTMTGGRFVTLFMADLQLESHSMLWINAGHVPPLLQTANAIVRLKAGTPPLGVLPEMKFEAQRIELAPGDRLLAYTDGVTEASNVDGGRMFGEKGLKEWLQAQLDLPLAELPQTLLAHLCAFSSSDDDSGACSLDDDMTLLCVQRERV